MMNSKYMMMFIIALLLLGNLVSIAGYAAPAREPVIEEGDKEDDGLESANRYIIPAGIVKTCTLSCSGGTSHSCTTGKEKVEDCGSSSTELVCYMENGSITVCTCSAPCTTYN